MIAPCIPYLIKSTAREDPRIAFMFEGVEGDLIGAGGLMPGGNAGIEIDRLSPRRGSPSDAVVVASSSDHTRLYETLDGVFPPAVSTKRPVIKRFGPTWSTSSVRAAGRSSR